MTQTLDGTGEVVLIDLRGGASVPADLHGPVLVLDRADQLVEHAALYRRLAGDRLVAGVVCVVVGESPGPSSAAVLRLPDSLRYAAVLWAGDERGVRWNPSADVVRPLGPEERGTIDQLVDALMVPEVFERVRAETEALVGGVASPGLCLVPGGVDRHELADARAAAVESLTTPGLVRTTSADDLLVRVARAGGASDVMPAPLVPGSPLHKAQTDALTRLDRLADLARDLGTWRALIGRERPTEALGTEVSLAGARAENYRLGLVELLDRMDGHLVLGTPAADQVTSLGVPAPVEARHAEASTELRRVVQERLNAGQPLPDLAADLRHAAANATPQGCAGSLEQVRATGPLALAMPRFRSSPLSVWTALLAFLCCAVMGFVLGPGWPGRIGALVLVLFWAGAGWLLRARRPDAEGEHGLGAAAVPALLLHGLPALLGGAVGVAVATVVPGILRPSSVTLQLLALLAVLVTLMTPVVCWSSAVRAWRKRFEVAELRKIVDGVSGVVEDAIKREWLQVERRRAVALTFEVVAAGVEEVGSSLAELGDRLFPRPTSGAGAAPGVAGLLRAVPPELLDVVRADLVAIAQRSLASSWVAAPSGRRAPAGVQAQLLEGELERYAAHVERHGLMTSPPSTADHGPRDRLMTRLWAESATAYPALTADVEGEMPQACRAAQLGYVRTSQVPARVPFAPVQVRRVLEQVPTHPELLADSRIVWCAGKELIGTLRLLPLRLESVDLLPAEVRGELASESTSQRPRTVPGGPAESRGTVAGGAGGVGRHSEAER